jgi:hypothetical protein
MQENRYESNASALLSQFIGSLGVVEISAKTKIGYPVVGIVTRRRTADPSRFPSTLSHPNGLSSRTEDSFPGFV